MRFCSGEVILRAEDSGTWLENPEKNGNVFSQFWGPVEVPLGGKMSLNSLEGMETVAFLRGKIKTLCYLHPNTGTNTRILGPFNVISKLQKEA